MGYHHHIPAFSTVVALYFLSLTASVIAGEDVLTSWTQGESGSLPALVSPDDAELEEVCKCLSSDSYSQPCAQLVNYSPIIRDGTCFGNADTQKRDVTMQNDASFGSPPAFVANKKCQGTRSIVLSSSGTERQLTLTTEGSVLICPGSIDTALQQLNVVGVNKIIIAPGAFKPRNSNIFLNFANVREKIIIPEKAFSVKVVPESPAWEEVEIDSTQPPPRVRMDINAVSEVEFKSRSIVAPIVKLKLSQINNIMFNTKAIIPYVHPEASSFEIGNCQSVELAPETINAGKFEAKYIKSLLMKERAVEVVEGKAKVEHIANMTLLDEALSIGSGADIILDNITLTSAGIRSIQGTGPGNIHRATFSHVKGKKLESVAICIRSETALVSSVEIAGGDGEIAACLQGQEYHADAIPGAVVICKKTEITAGICDDPRCEKCSSNTEGTETQTTLIPSSMTTTLTSVAWTEDPFIILNAVNVSSLVTSTETSTISQLTANMSSTVEVVIVPVRTSEKDVLDIPSLTHYGKLKDESYGSDSSFLKSLKDTPIYIIIIFFCAVIILILFMTYMIYKCCTHNKHDKYNLPQENRLSTFRNPRTITTPENLTDQNNAQKANNLNTPEVYSTYDSYRRRPAALYVAHSETLEFGDSSGSTDGHSVHCDEVPNNCKISPDSSVNLNHQENPLNNLDHHDFPTSDKDLPSAEISNHPNEEVPLDLPTETCSPHPCELPPPEGYLKSEDHVPNTISSTSDNEYSQSENNPPPSSLQNSPTDTRLDLSLEENYLPRCNEPVDTDEQTLDHNGIPLQNKYYSSMELPMYAPPPVPTFDKVESDGDELVI
ncbi:uncharacterized protein LOC135206631 [Macrobrachium nipponense]|uniref:uncharacterized protein LOC135206631 n=1 Tax=Macrobrachium nipponense TaxID=159736 RepID=UPI0030C7DD28